MIIVGILGLCGRNEIIVSASEILSKSRVKYNVIHSSERFSNINTLNGYISILKDNKTKILIINISYEDIENHIYDNLKFDILAHSSINKTFLSNEEQLNRTIEYDKKIFKQLQNKNYILINIDDDNYIKQLENIDCNVITYGFNSKSTLTSSSIDDNCNILTICQQRNVHNIYNKLIEPQEFIINLKSCEVQSVYNALIVVGLLLLFDIRSHQINNKTI